MSTSNSLSPVPIESDSKQSKNDFLKYLLARFTISTVYLGSQGPSLVFNKRKKLEIKAVFNADEDDTAVPKKRKLVPLGNTSEKVFRGVLCYTFFLHI